MLHPQNGGTIMEQRPRPVQGAKACTAATGVVPSFFKQHAI